MRLAGIIIVAISLLAIFWEVFGYGSWLIFYGSPVGGMIGIVGCMLGTVLITIPGAMREIREKSMNNFLEWYVTFVDNFSDNLGYGVGWFTTLMVVVVFVNVLFRYVLGQSFLALQDLSWYVFGVIFMVGAAYTLRHDRHVRVDVVYVNLSPKAKVWVNLIGSLFFLVPLCILGIWVSWGFVERSWTLQETSPDAGGLDARYLAKAMMPVGFILIMIQGFSLFFKSILQLMGRMPIEEHGGAH